MKKCFLSLLVSLLYIMPSQAQDVVPYRLHDKWGFADVKGQMIIPPAYDSIEFIKYPTKKAKIWLNKKTGMIDITGRQIIPALYDSVHVKEKYIMVYSGNKKGLLDTAGNILLPATYDDIRTSKFSRYFITTLNKKQGMATLNGKEAVKNQYDSVGFINTHKAIVWLNRKTGMIDTTGREIVPLIYDSLDVDLDFIIAQSQGKKGVLNLSGGIQLPLSYDDIQFTYTTQFIITRNNLKGIAVKSGNTVRIARQPEFNNIEFNYKDDYYVCSKKGMKIFLDAGMRVLSKPPEREEEIGPAIMTLTESEDDQHTKYWTARKKEEALKYENRHTHNNDITLLRDEFDGVLYARKNGWWGATDTKGNVLAPFEYEDVDLNATHARDGNSLFLLQFAFKKNGKWGMVGRNNNAYSNRPVTVLIPFEFDSLQYSNDNVFIITVKNGLKGAWFCKSFLKNVPPKYLHIEKTYARVYPKYILRVIPASQKPGFISEDGVEFFKDE